MDAPIGYSGAPYLRNAHYKSPNKLETPKVRPSSIRLEDFPPEILMIIASCLSQFEILSLLQVNGDFNRIFKLSLYQRVTIDNGFSQFNYKEISLVQNTFIKTSYSLKMFLRKIKSNPHLCGLIRHFVCQKLPNDITKIELYGLISSVFPHMTNLDELNWYNSNDIDLKLLKSLSTSSSSLTELSINSRLFHHLKSPDLSFHFNFLTTFAYTPFQNSENLLKMMPLFDFTNLKNLKVSRLFDKESLLLPPSNSLVTREDVFDLDLGTFNLLFGNNSKKLKLEKLSVDGALIQPSDFLKLSKSIFLNKLKYLELLNVSEIVKIDIQNNSMIPGLSNEELTDDLRFELRSLIVPNFITHLSTLNMRNLTDLKIDVRQGLVDSTPNLISSLKCLKNLDVITRWNNTKIFEFQDFNNLILQLTDSILFHASTLRKLSIELRLENTLINNESAYTLPNDHLIRLLDGRFPRLAGLRLNVHANFLISKNNLLSIHNFPSLKYLNLFGDDIYRKHMGLQVLNPGILDDFFKIQHIVVNLLKNIETNLGYIMIDQDKVFELNCNNLHRLVDLIPRDGINHWFMSKVRAGFFY